MRPQDLTVEVRDRNLKRLGQVLPRDLSLSAKLRWCGVGEWTLTLPGDHAMVPALLEPGSGLLVTSRATGAPEVLFSGPTLAPNRKRDQKNPGGTLTFTGVTDEVLLEDSLAFPDPQGSADPTAQTKANDTRTSNTLSLMRQYVAYNIANGALAATGPVTWALPGRLRGLRNKLRLPTPSPPPLGVTQTKSPRFQNLLELLQELAVYDGGVGFRVVQVDEVLEFQHVPVRDLRGEIRLDIKTGTITSEEISNSGPQLTDAIVAGQGEGTERTIVRRSDLSSESTWARPIERFFDRRDTDIAAELQQKGDEELTAAEGGTSAKIVPSDDHTMQYLTDWRQGDWVTVVVNGQERDSVVTEAVLLFDSSKSVVGAAIGDVANFSPENRQTRKQETIDSRLSYLERTGGLPGRLASDAKQVTDWNQATEAGFYYGNNAANSPIANSLVGVVYPATDISRLVQELRRPAMGATDSVQTFRRVWSGSAWSAWVRIGNEPWTGPTTDRAAMASKYWEFWNDSTDGKLYVGDKSGGWRLFSGQATTGVAAWDATGTGGTVSAAGRTFTSVLPTVLETNEHVLVTATSIGTGYGWLTLQNTVRGATNTTVTLRAMQLLNLTTQGFAFLWQIARL